MEELLKVVASHVALAVETAAVLIVAFGAVQAVRSCALSASLPSEEAEAPLGALRQWPLSRSSRSRLTSCAAQSPGW
jgi:hypothetical protein